MKQTLGVPHVIVPPWNLEVVLLALKPDSFHPIEHADLKCITLKTIFLVEVTLARRASKIHALQVDHLNFGSTMVTGFTALDFRPKVDSHWHLNQPIKLTAMYLEKDHALHKVCVCHALNAYLAAMKHLRKRTKSFQLFLSYGGSIKGKPMSKKWISQWLKLVVQEYYALI